MEVHHMGNDTPPAAVVNDPATIKPIETLYHGYRFRSRLEAKWAVFLDRLSIPWEYEHQGFDVAGEWYLPDFFLPEHDAYLEIKPPRRHVETPTVYLAGKMGERHDYRGIFGRDSRRYASYGPNGNADWDWSWGNGDPHSIRIGVHDLGYSGPYTASCDHGCAHGSQHKAANCGEQGREDGLKRLNLCRLGVETCSLFFAHFETADQFGTLVELGWANARKKRIWMTMDEALRARVGYDKSKGFSFGDHDLWFAEFCADKFAVTDKPIEQLTTWLDEELPPCRERVLAEHMNDAGLSISVAYGDPLDCTYYPARPMWMYDVHESFNTFLDAAKAARAARFEHGECG
jgi:hypothetical protein